jgi:hypothetical protein
LAEQEEFDTFVDQTNDNPSDNRLPQVHWSAAGYVQTFGPAR